MPSIFDTGKTIEKSGKKCNTKTHILNEDGICADCQPQVDTPPEEPENPKCNKYGKISSKPLDSRGFCTGCTGGGTSSNKIFVILGVAIAFIAIAGTVSYLFYIEKGDTVPNEFLFQKQDNVDKNTVLQSNEIQVSGIDTPVNIKIDNGKYSIDGQNWTNQESTVGNHAKVKVQHTTSQDFNDSVSTVLSIGGVQGIFLSNTVLKDVIPDNFIFNKKENVELNTVVISNEITISGINTETNISILGGQYSIDSAAWKQSESKVSNGSKIKVKHKSGSSSNQTVSTTLTVGGVKGIFTSVSKKISRCDKWEEAFHVPADGC